MEMTIEEIIRSLTAMKSVVGVNQFTINEAIEKMQRYQKIEQIVDKWNEGIYDDEGLCHTEVLEMISDEVYKDENNDC